MSKKIVYRVTTEITEWQLAGFLDQINKDEEDNDIGHIDLARVMRLPHLLKFLCDSAVEDGVAVYDPEEGWNNDVWSGWEDEYYKDCPYDSAMMDPDSEK